MPYKDPARQKAAQRAYHLRHKEARRERQKQRRQELRDWIVSLKAGQPCADCGDSFHFTAMHWDHLPGYEKVAGIREMVNRFQNKALIEQELAKCELVCANCHAIRTYLRAGSDVT